MWSYVLAGAAGAAIAYLFDPDRGKRRRNMARDRSLAFLRHQGMRLSRSGRRAAGAAYGITQEVAHAPDIREALDDATLARKVESEVFRDPTIPKGSINVNVVDGVVVLRGELHRPEQINEIEAAVRRIPDVIDVQNLLHLPGQPAPNKAAAMSAERRPRMARGEAA
jgi:osmotically-inducible protein OsmY